MSHTTASTNELSIAQTCANGNGPVGSPAVVVIDNTMLTVDAGHVATFADSFRRFIESQMTDVETGYTVKIDHYAGYAAEAYAGYAAEAWL